MSQNNKLDVKKNVVNVVVVVVVVVAVVVVGCGGVVAVVIVTKSVINQKPKMISTKWIERM